MTYDIQVKFVARAIKCYLDTGMMFSRNGTPTHLKALVTSYTGKQYKRGRNGLIQAGADLEALMASMADLHEIVPFSQR